MSPKYIDFINTVHGVRADFLEGTTASGKTTVGAGVKFMRMISLSGKKMHILASRTTGTAEKNIIQQDNGILDLHRGAVYNGNGSAQFKFPHILFEDKVIYVLGYDTRDKWENVLGGQYGCVYIDEINTANIEFVREISTRNDYLMATLNPDDPNLPIYKEFINKNASESKLVSVGKNIGIVFAIFSVIVGPMVYFFPAGLKTFLDSFVMLVGLPVLSGVFGGFFFNCLPKYSARFIMVFHIICYGGFMLLSPSYSLFGGNEGSIHYLYAVSILWPLEMLIMYLMHRRNKSKGAEVWVQQDVGAVDLTPWKYSKLVSVIVIVCVLLVYLAFSPLGIGA